MYNNYGYGSNYGYDYGNAVGSVLGGLLIFLVIISIIALAVSIVTLIAQWKLFKKAGKGGWEAIVPFYCNYVLVEIAGLKWYWFLFFFAPFVCNLIGIEIIGWLAYLFTMFNIFYNISKRCSKGVGFAICATLFTPICMMILGFSKKISYDKNIPVSEHGVFEKPENNVQPTYQQPNQVNVMQQPVEPEPMVAPVQPVPTVDPISPVEPIVPVKPEPNQELNNQSVAPTFCTNCGNALMPNAKFCTNCGKQI